MEEKWIIHKILFLGLLFGSYSFNVMKHSKFEGKITTLISQQSPVLFVGKRNGFFSSLIQNNTEQHLVYENYRSLKYPMEYNIFHFSELEEFKETITYLRNFEIFGTRKKYICVTENPAHVQKLIYFLSDLDLYKSMVVLEKVDTLNFFHANYQNCGRNVTVKEFKLENFQEVFEKKNHKNFKNCVLRVAYATVPPWIYIENGEKVGLLVDFLKLVIEQDNLKLEYLANNYEDDISNSYNFDNLHNEFEDGKGDVFIGLVNFYPALYFDVTHTLIDDSMLLMIPKGKKMSYLKALLHIYTIRSWGLTMILFIIFFILLCIIGRSHYEQSFRSPIKNFTFIFSIFLGMSVPKTMNTVMIKFLFLTMFLVCMINCIIIQGKLFSIISVPVHERNINDIPTLLKSHLPIKFKEGISMLFFDNKPESEEILRIFRPTNDSIPETADELVRKKDFATILDKIQLITKPSLGDLVTYIELVNFQVVYLFKKHHHLFEHLNFEIQRCIESGFMDRLVSSLKFKELLQNEDYKKSYQAFKLTLEHLQGPCYILFVGLLLSTISFSAELFIYHLSNS